MYLRHIHLCCYTDVFKGESYYCVRQRKLDGDYFPSAAKTGKSRMIKDVGHVS